jgi:drug/metabolite transporter (DMT)-like permease
MNPTLIGVFSVVVWGIALPFMRIVEDRIGCIGYVAITFTGPGLIGIANQLLRRNRFLTKVHLLNPYFYARWLFFCLHEGLLVLAVSMVQKQNMPFVILLNYLWPTAIILCSVLLAGVRITRWPWFIFGTLIVMTAMSIEIIGPAGISSDLFAVRSDCLAYALVVTGAFSWGFYSAFSRTHGDATGAGGVIPLFQLSLGIPAAFLPGATWHGMTPLLAGVLAGYCVIQVLAYLSWDHGMRRGNVVILSLFADFIPWLSLFAAHAMLGVGLGGRTILSALLLVAGAMVTRYGTLQKKLAFEQYEVPDM